MTVLSSRAVGLLALPSAARDTTTSPQVFDTSDISYAAWDLTLTSFTGGTSPTVTFFLERLGLDGNWYQIGTTSAMNSAPTTVSVDISPALNSTMQAPLLSTAQHNVFTFQARLRWTFGGTVAPTAVTFSSSIVGRSGN